MTFFSSVDQTELKDNASQYNYYISLIVNFAHVYCAKIAFPSKTNVISEYWVKDDNGKLFKRKSTKEESIILIGDLNVIIEDDTIVPQWLDGRIEGLELKKKQTLVISSQPYIASDRFGGFDNDYGRKSNSYYDDFDWQPEVFKKEEKFSTNSKVINFSKAQEFLAALIYLDSAFKNNSIINGLKALEALKPEEMATFESCLDANFEIIHQNIYESEVQMSKHTLQALTELMDYEDKFGLTQGYQIINEIVGSYAL